MPKGDVENVAVREATKRGIVVVFVPQAYGYSIADYAFALMLAAARRIPQINYALKFEGRLELEDEYPGTDISFKTLGIIGFGRIGQLIAKRAKGFDMRVLAYDPYVPEDRTSDVELVELDTLLQASDFVTIHLPKSPWTRHVIGEREFSLMKTGTFFINTATRSVVDEKALIASLANGKLAGAALDCLAQEPPEPANPLLKMENVIITPFSWACRVKSLEPDICVAEDIAKVLKGERPTNIANPEVLKDTDILNP